MSEERMEKEQILSDLYYSPKTGYRSPDHLWDLAREEYPDTEISKHFVKQWLLRQSTYTKFRKWNNPRHYRQTFVRDFDELQMDLVFPSLPPGKSDPITEENDGYWVILVAIEILSRFMFAYPLKSKEGKVVKPAIEKLIGDFEERFNGRIPKLMAFDEGGEFMNKDVIPYLESLDIVYFSAPSPKKAAVVERANRTLKTKMAKMFHAEGNHRWIDKLQDLVSNYNSTYHRSIKMRPKDVNDDNKFVVWGRLFGHLIEIKKPKFKIGDRVRILHFDWHHRKSQFTMPFREKYPEAAKKSHAVKAKGKAPFSEEIFDINRVLLGDPVVYKLYSDETKEEVLGVFYEEELSLVKEEE